MDTIDSNQQFMRRFVEFINTADSTMARDLVSPNAIFHVPGRPDPLTGPEGYLAIIAMMRGGFPDIQWTLEEMVVEPTKVAARFTMRGSTKAHFWECRRRAGRSRYKPSTSTTCPMAKSSRNTGSPT